MLLRKRFVSGLMQAGVSLAGIQEMAQRPDQMGRLPVGPVTSVQIEYVYRQLSKELSAQFEEDRAHEKAKQLDRLKRDMARLRARLSPTSGQEIPVSEMTRIQAQLTRVELLYARVAGTLEPVKVKIDIDAVVRDSFVAVIADLDATTADELIEEQRQLESRVKVIDTEGEAA